MYLSLYSYSKDQIFDFTKEDKVFFTKFEVEKDNSTRKLLDIILSVMF